MIKFRTIIFTLAITVGLFGVALHAAAMTINSPQSKSFQQSTGLNSGLVGWWTFDGADISGTSVTDKSGKGNTGTRTGTYLTAGKLGQALFFQRANKDYVDVGNGSGFHFTNGSGQDLPYSFSMWIYQTDNSGLAQIPISKFNGLGSLEWATIISPTNLYINNYGDNSGATNYIGRAASYSGALNKWHHIVFTYTGNNAGSGFKIYSDGVRVDNADNSATPYTGIVNSSVTVKIGVRFRSGAAENLFSGPFQGKIDDARIYNRALSPSEVKQLYAQGVGTKINQAQSKSYQQGKGINSGLVGWWTFDGADTSGSSVFDKTAQGNTGTKTTAVKSTVGKIGQGLRFPGTLTDYVSIPDSSSLSPGNGNFAVSLWFKFIAKGDKYLGGDYGAYLYNDYGSVSNNLVNIVLQTDVDNKILATYRDGSGNALLISGVGSVLTDQKWHHVAWIKNNKTGVLYTDGQLVSSVTNNSIGTITTNDANPIIIGRYATAGLGGLNGYMDDVRVYNRALSATEVKQLYIQSAGTKINQPPSESSLQGKGINSGLLGWWTFDGADVSGTNVLDKSGQNNTGTKVAGVQNVPGKIGQAMKFDGNTGSEISVSPATSINPTQATTFSAWIKTTDGEGTIASKDDIGTNRQLAFIVSTGRAEFYAFQNSGLYSTAGAAAVIVNDGRWHHVVGTIDTNTDGKARIYVDGTLSDTAAVSIASIASTSRPIYIGDRETNALPLAGIIDDVRIYNRALSLAEIKQLYAMGK